MVWKWFLLPGSGAGGTVVLSLSLCHFLDTQQWHMADVYLHGSCVQILFLQQVEADCSPRLSVWFLPVRESIAGARGISTGYLGNLRFWAWDGIGKKQHSVVIFCWRRVQISRGDTFIFMLLPLGTSCFHFWQLFCFWQIIIIFLIRV